MSIRPLQEHHSAEIVRRLQDEFGILVTDRSGMIRVSPHIDNDHSQIEFLFASSTQYWQSSQLELNITTPTQRHGKPRRSGGNA